MKRPDVKIVVRRMGGRWYVVRYPDGAIIPAEHGRVHHQSHEAASQAAQVEQSWASR